MEADGLDGGGSRAPTLAELDAATGPGAEEAWDGGSSQDLLGMIADFGSKRSTSEGAAPPKPADVGSADDEDLAAPPAPEAPADPGEEAPSFWSSSEEIEAPPGDGPPTGRPGDSGVEIEFEDGPTPGMDAVGGEMRSMASIPPVPDELVALSSADAVTEAQRLFEEGHAEEGVALLEAAAGRNPGDSSIETWLDIGERRLIAKYCPDVRGTSVPKLTKPKRELLRVTQGPQRRLVTAIDGERSISEVRSVLPDVQIVVFWKDLAKLNERGWLEWRESER
jgi:hypothetical protein